MLLGVFFEWRHWLAEHAEGYAEKYCILRCLAKWSKTHSEQLNAIRWLESLYHSAFEILLLVIIGSDSYHVFPVILCCATGCVTGYAYSIKDTCIVCAFHSLLKLIKASSLGTFKWYQMIYDRSLGHFVIHKINPVYYVMWKQFPAGIRIFFLFSVKCNQHSIPAE